MAAKLQEISINIGGNANGAVAALNAVNSAAANLEARMRSRSFAADAKSFFRGGDEAGAAKALGKLAAGGGAAIGITLISKSIDDVALHAKEFAVAMRAGDASWGDLTERIAASIPIIGQAWQAGRNLRASGEDIHAERLRVDGGSEQEVREAMSDESLLQLDRQNDAKIQALAEAQRESRIHANAAGKVGAEAQRAAAEMQHQRAMGEISKQREGIKDLWESNRAPAQAALRAMELDADREYQVKLRTIEKAEGERRREQAERIDADIATARVKNSARMLREMGDNLGAETALLRNAAEQSIRSIDESVRTRTMADPKNAAEIAAQAEHQKAQVALDLQSDTLAAQRANEKQSAEHSLSTNRQLFGAKIQLMEDQARRSSGYAKNELEERVELSKTAMEFDARLDELKKTRDDNTLSRAQRQQAENLIAKTQAARSLALEHPFHALGRIGATASAQNSQHLMGAAAASREGDTSRTIAKNTAQGAAAAGATAKAIDATNTILADIKTALSGFVNPAF